MPLTIKAIEAAKPKEKAYKLTDSDGLYLYIPPTGARVWRANYREGGKQLTATYGKYPSISLAEARRLNADRKERVGTKQKRTVADVAEEMMAIKMKALKNDKDKIQWQRTVRDHVLAYIGGMRLDEVTRADMAAVVKRLDHIPETAKRVAGRMRMIFDYAIDEGEIDSHPGTRLTKNIPKVKSVSHPCVDPEEAGQLIEDILSYNDLVNPAYTQVTRLALLLAIHTLTRTAEIRFMTWSEIRPDDNIWVVPENRMKKGLPHVVPLSPQVLEILSQLREINGDTDLVLASPMKRHQPISENTMLYALYSLGYRGRQTVHGFRALGSTVLNESTLFSPDAIERQLSHDESNEVRKAYNRAKYLAERRIMMPWYSDWLTEQYNSRRRKVSNG